MRNNDMWNWGATTNCSNGNSIFLYLCKIKEGTNPNIFEKKVQNFFQQQAGADMKAAGF
jgi:hypothetical protein